MFVLALRTLVLNLLEYADRFHFATFDGEPATQAEAIVDALCLVFCPPALPREPNSRDADLFALHFPAVFGFFAWLGVGAANFFTTGVALLNAVVTFSSRRGRCQQEAQREGKES